MGVGNFFTTAVINQVGRRTWVGDPTNKATGLLSHMGKLVTHPAAADRPLRYCLSRTSEYVG